MADIFRLRVMCRCPSILLSAALCLLLPALSGCILAGRSSRIEVTGACLKGNELRLVVQTSQSSSPFYSHMEKVYNVRHYYVAVDLNAKGSLREASTIVGPLWIEKDRDPQVEFIPGWGQSTQTHFEEDGELIKIDWDEIQAKWLRSRLALEPGRATWRDAGIITPIPAPTNIFSQNLRTPSGNWQIHFDENGGAELYETSNGRKIADPWLEQTISRLYRLPSVGKEHRIEDIKLTDDLKYVVYWPSQSFDWEGRKYSLTEKPYRNTGLLQRSQEYAVSFERPNADGDVFRKSDWSDTPFSMPIGYLSVQGKLCFLKVNTNRVGLIDQKGQTSYASAAPGLLPHYYTLQQDDSQGRIIFFDHLIIPMPFHMGIWTYEKGTFESCDIAVYSLFTHFFSSFRPVKKINPETGRGERLN
jgi:hypothetical protein